MPHLHLAEMRAERAGTFTIYTSPLADRRNDTRYEATIHGAPALVEAVFGKVGVTVDIDPDATEEDAAKRAQDLLAPFNAQLDAEMRQPWNLRAPRPRLAAASPLPKASRTITVSLRRTSGTGTFWWIGTPLPVAWPPGTLIQFVLPRCFTGGAMAVPAGGNPDVLIRFNGPFAPIAASSLRGGLAVDATGFTNAPWFHVFPWNQFLATGRTPAVAAVSCWGFSLLPF
jgi:hypothetical protein